MSLCLVKPVALCLTLNFQNDSGRRSLFCRQLCRNQEGGVCYKTNRLSVKWHLIFAQNVFTWVERLMAKKHLHNNKPGWDRYWIQLWTIGFTWSQLLVGDQNRSWPLLGDRKRNCLLLMSNQNRSWLLFSDWKRNSQPLVGNQNESQLLAGNWNWYLLAIGRQLKLVPIGYWQAIEIDTYWLLVGDWNWLLCAIDVWSKEKFSTINGCPKWILAVQGWPKYWSFGRFSSYDNGPELFWIFLLQ